MLHRGILQNKHISTLYAIVSFFKKVVKYQIEYLHIDVEVHYICASVKLCFCFRYLKNML